MKYSVPTVSINLNAVKQNYLNVKKFCKTAETSALVKATSYGLGGENRIVTTLAKSGCKQFFVAQINEGLKIREKFKNIKGQFGAKFMVKRLKNRTNFINTSSLKSFKDFDKVSDFRS